MAGERHVIFVHGWSVRSTDTYGGFPDRLAAEAKKQGQKLVVHQIFLGKYVSFRDVVRVEDLSRAFQAALKRLKLEKDQRFACITHSTGGPVVRDWLHRYYIPEGKGRPCPMSHLIMLAPANFGSALAQLGKARVSRIKAWFEGEERGDVQPGQGVLDWLELGSSEAWQLNMSWIGLPPKALQDCGTFLFVLTGQTIDRKLYDHLNSYTGEAGSDGVVRVAAANLNATYVLLEQETPGDADHAVLKQKKFQEVSSTAFALISGRSHSGEEKGILRSVKNDGAAHPTVEAVLACLGVAKQQDYAALCADFEKQTRKVMKDEKVEYERKLLLKSTYVHDPHCMVIFRIRDDRGSSVPDFDLKLIGGRETGEPSPDLLPKGVFVDRQRNKRDGSTLTLYLNHDLIYGHEAKDSEGIVVRKKTEGTKKLGLELVARPEKGQDIVHYARATLIASSEALTKFLKPHQTTLVDIVLKRVVRESTFRLTTDRTPKDFTEEALKVDPSDPENTGPGKPID